MAFDKTQLPGWYQSIDITTTFNVGSLTVTKLLVYRMGSEFVFEFQMSDSSTHYLKVKQTGKVKVNGTSPQFDNGTEVVWPSS